MNKKKPTAGTAGLKGGKANLIKCTPIISNPPKNYNPHLYALRRQAEAFIARARIANNRQRYRRHFAVYLAILAAEARKGQL